MGRQIPQDILDSQPEPPRPNRRADNANWFQKNWFCLVTIAWLVFTQLFGGGAWVSGRENTERQLTERVNQLATEAERERTLYVRQDVFDAVLRRIDERLTSIDGKLPTQGKR